MLFNFSSNLIVYDFLTSFEWQVAVSSFRRRIATGRNQASLCQSRKYVGCLLFLRQHGLSAEKNSKSSTRSGPAEAADDWMMSAPTIRSIYTCLFAQWRWGHNAEYLFKYSGVFITILVWLTGRACSCGIVPSFGTTMLRRVRALKQALPRRAPVSVILHSKGICLRW